MNDLKVVEFLDNGDIANSDKILGDTPYTVAEKHSRGIDYKRECTVWLKVEDAVLVMTETGFMRMYGKVTLTETVRGQNDSEFAVAQCELTPIKGETVLVRERYRWVNLPDGKKRLQTAKQNQS